MSQSGTLHFLQLESSRTLVWEVEDFVDEKGSLVHNRDFLKQEQGTTRLGSIQI